jgi:rubrerythrin
MPEEQPWVEHLREAFAREAQAAARCLYFARRADVEGRADVASLLRALAEGEYGQAFGHLEFLEDGADPLAGGGDTAANLESAVGEADANADAYSAYAEEARAARQPDVADWFDSVSAAKRAHAAQLRSLPRSLEAQ